MKDSVTVAVDLAKNVFELAVAESSGRIVRRHRCSRAQFEQFWALREPCRVVMEACASAHFWARRLQGLGCEVVLLPPHYVRPYVRRGKTDRTDCEALLEAVRSGGIHPVSVKSEDQQAILALHRVRSQWMATRTARINGMRALMREFGVACSTGAKSFLAHVPELLHEKEAVLPPRVCRMVFALWEEVRDMEERIKSVEKELESVACEAPAVQALLNIPGVGLLTATGLYAAVANIHTFKTGRHLASWLGLTPREHSSGSRRHLGRISKQGDVYLRMLLIHGARSALLVAQKKKNAGQALTGLQAWALERAETRHANQVAVALANKMARVIWAVWKHERSFEGNHASRLPQPA